MGNFICKNKKLFSTTDVVEKPKLSESPSNFAIIEDICRLKLMKLKN